MYGVLILRSYERNDCMKRALYVLVALALAVTAVGCKAEGKNKEGKSDILSAASAQSEIAPDGSESETGASGEQQTSPQQSAASKKDSAIGGASLAESQAQQLKNYKFVFGTIFPEQYQTGGARAAEFNAKVSELKTKYGVTVTLQGYKPEEFTQQVNGAIMAGKDVPNALETGIVEARNLMTTGALADLKSFSGIKLDNGNFLNWSTEGNTFNGKTYAVSTSVRSFFGMFFNDDMVKKEAKADIYKLYKNGEWTWSKMREIAVACKKDLDGDKRTDVYGVIGRSSIIGTALVSSAGGTSVKQNGKIRVVMCDQPGIDAITYLRTLHKTDATMKYVTNVEDTEKVFIEKGAALLCHNLDYANGIGSKIDFTMGYVPFPKPDGTAKYNAAVYGTNVYCIPRNVKDKEITGVVLNELSYLGKVDIEKVIKSLKSAGISQDGINIYNDQCKNAVMDYSLGPHFTAEINTKIENCVINSGSQPQSVIEGIRSSAQKLSDDYYNSIK